jgi:hypothetical protein
MNVSTDMTIENQCAECHAGYATSEDSCAVRFEHLLALDHSRREPWASRHGQAFAAFALQHPEHHAGSLDSVWMALYRIYCLEEAPRFVFAALRNSRGRSLSDARIPKRPRHPAGLPAVTIADLGDFTAEDYPVHLDAWCQASLRAWGVPIGVAAA